MSINMDSAGGTEYADHDVQVIGVALQTNTDPGAEIDIIRQFDPVIATGLDSDELAELVAMDVYLSIHSDQENADGNAAASRTKAEAEVGINLTEGEFPAQSFANNPTATQETVADGEIETVNYNEPGVLYSTRSSPSSSFKSAEGGGSGGHETQSESVDFRDRFGSGPYLDRTDDITVHAEVADEQLTGSSKFDMNVVLYWSVEEMPEGRASFARP